MIVIVTDYTFDPYTDVFRKLKVLLILRKYQHFVTGVFQERRLAWYASGISEPLRSSKKACDSLHPIHLLWNENQYNKKNGRWDFGAIDELPSYL